MEKKNSGLRKLKKDYRRREKQERSRALNKKFQLDPGRVNASRKEIINRNGDDDDDDDDDDYYYYYYYYCYYYCYYYYYYYCYYYYYYK